MKPRLALKPNEQVFLWGIVATGLSIVAASLVSWQTSDAYRYGCLVLLASAAAGFKISLPGMTGALSANFLFILYGIIEFTFSETVLMASFLTLMQCLANWRKSLRWHQVVFNVGLSSIATALAFSVARFKILEGPYLETSVGLLAGALVLFVAHNVPAAMMISIADQKTFGDVWRECFLWTLPYYVLGAAATGLGVIAGPLLGWQTAILVVPILYLVYRSYSLYLAQLQDEKKHTEDIAALHLRTIEALALAIEAKDTDSHDHLHRVQTFATGLAEELGLPESEVNAVRAAALLHDIGKLAVPEHIISKRTRLTAEETERLQIHPVVGAEILSRARFPYPVEPIVRSHHERFDGGGYPDRLAGEAIPLGARILTVADAFDEALAMASGVSRKPLEDAMRIVEQGRGGAFDPKVLDALQRSYLRLEQLAAHTIRQRPGLPNGLAGTRMSFPAAGFADEGGETEPSSAFLQSIAAARQEVQTLFELAQDLGNSLSIEETLELLTKRMERTVAHDCIVLFLLNGNRLEAYHVGGKACPRWAGTSMLVGEGLSGWVAENGKPILNGNPAVENGYQPADQAVMRSALSVPLEGLNGQMGVMTFYSAQRDAFTRDHLRVLLAITSKIALSIENALKFLHAENSATTDYLTGLPNARSLYLHLEAEISRCERTGQNCSILVCDLDGFKQVNDRFGHLEGNRVLRLVSAGMKEVCRDYDYVARMGGDEFVVVLPAIRPVDATAKIMAFEKVAIDAGLEICGERVLAMSIGVAHYPEDGITREALIQSADERMYANKRENKKRLHENAQAHGWKLHAPPRTTTR
jgi:diguanylate cyclase (GGDEF)-like protein/putative nucleotidyltransferase with HDIG domain